MIYSVNQRYFRLSTRLFGQISKVTCLSFLFLGVCCSLSYAQVDNVGSKKMQMNINGNTLKIPYYANYDLNTTRTDITHALVVVHGANRNADDYFFNMQTAASMRPTESDSTLIIAPQFLTESDIDANLLDGEHLYWSSGGWKSGSNSRDNPNNPRPERIPSYAVLDTMLQKIAQNFPNVRSFVFTGHSAGAQVANRYSASSPMIDILQDQYQICSKFVVANPSSYIYLDEQRRVQRSTDSFAVPSTACSGYNEWKYGLEELYTYPSASGIDSIRRMLKRREVVYLLGENDNDPNSSSLDTSCEADLQGSHRLERGSIYLNYLKHYYGNEILARHSLDTVPNAGHSNFDMYTSSIGLSHLFETPPTSCQDMATSITPSRLNSFVKVYPNPTKDLLTIEAPARDARIRIVNLAGVEVMKMSHMHETSLSIDLSRLSDGVYILSYQLGSEVARKLIRKGAF